MQVATLTLFLLALVGLCSCANDLTVCRADLSTIAQNLSSSYVVCVGNGHDNPKVIQECIPPQETYGTSLWVSNRDVGDVHYFVVFATPGVYRDTPALVALACSRTATGPIRCYGEFPRGSLNRQLRGTDPIIVYLNSSTMVMGKLTVDGNPDTRGGNLFPMSPLNISCGEHPDLTG